MSLLFDSFWRAVAYCVHPRVIALSFGILLTLIQLAWHNLGSTAELKNTPSPMRRPATAPRTTNHGPAVPLPPHVENSVKVKISAPSAAYAQEVSLSAGHARVWRLYQAFFLRQPDQGGFGSDHDSVGMFQQRPPYWGQPAQLIDPRYASAKFYQKLLGNLMTERWEDACE